MKHPPINLLTLYILFSFFFYKTTNESKPLDEETWKLSLGMIEKSWNKN